MDLNLAPETRRALLASAREAIASALEKRPPSWPEDAKVADERCGVFVSLHIGSYLRGCIGRMSSGDPLYATVREMARAAAFEDPRFPPLSVHEFASVNIEITVLAPLRRISGLAEIEIGRHGVHIMKGMRSAVFLPQVATEQGWDRDTLLEELCRKAGLSPGSWRSPDSAISIFEGLVFGETERYSTH